MQYQDHEVYGIWRRVAGRWVQVRKCESLDEVRRQLVEDREELDHWWERWRKVPQERRPSNAPREPAGRDGTADPEVFTRRFSFRGVQFGNWVEAGRRTAELQETSQALVELGRMLGRAPKALALGGRLGLAFGARGKGGAQSVRAHYESGERVIAISKPSGAGTLAREWFQALDHHAAMLVGEPGRAMATTARPPTGDSAVVRLARAISPYGHVVRNTGMAKRSKELDRRRPKSKAYRSTAVELTARAFEAWVAARRRDAGIRNDYLVNFLGGDEWPGERDMDMGYPYPYAEELAELSDFIGAIAEAGREVAREWARGNGRHIGA